MKRIVAISAVALLASALLAGCGAPEAEPPSDQVSVRLKWLHGAQFAGLYVAEQMGFFATENIEVTLNTGGPDVDEMLEIASGQDDFGVIGADQAVVRRVEDLSVVAIAVIFRRNPAVYFALEESGIEEPGDFVGRSVLRYPPDYMLPAMLTRAGIDIRQVDKVSPGEYDMQGFFAGEVDVWTGYLTNEVITARQQGYELNVIYPDDYGIHVYGDTMMTTERMIEENPDLVERFLRAALRGWSYAIENPDEAVAITLKYEEELDEAQQRAMMEAQIPLIQTAEDEIGWMRADVWQGIYDILLEQGLVDEPFDVEDAYTMEFLEAIYGGQQ